MLLLFSCTLASPHCLIVCAPMPYSPAIFSRVRYLRLDYSHFHSHLSVCFQFTLLSHYTLQFRTLANGAGWNEEALNAVFVQGLSESVCDKLVTRDAPVDFKALASLAIQSDNRLQEQCSLEVQRSLSCSGKSSSLSALVDSGAEDNFLDSEFTA